MTLSWHDRSGKRIGSKGYPSGHEAIQAAKEEFGASEQGGMIDEAPYSGSAGEASGTHSQ